MAFHHAPTLASLLFALSLAGSVAPAAAQSTADRDAVRQAALDYVEALYLVQPARIEKSVHPALVKRGLYRRPEDATYQPMGQMTYDQLVALAGSWNKDGKQDTSTKEVAVLDVLDMTATAKVVAHWGVDYMQLAKQKDGRWLIVNILWQSHPQKAGATAQ